MAKRDTKQEAFRAGFENPLMGDIAPLQRLYGTVSAIGSELGGGDMGTPFGQRFGERQAATKAEVKRLQDLRAKHPEEFGRGMMQAQEQMDPYMLGLGTGAVGGMRPMGSTRFTPAPGEAPIGELPGYAPRGLSAPQAAPAAPYYRNVPPEMGTSPGPMNAFNQNMYGMSTGRYGARGYAPEMAVTDFESYGPMGARPSPGAYAPSGFDQNMLNAYRQGRYNRMRGGRPSMGGEYTLEELGSAPAPYRQGGLVYEPVGPQGATRGPLEGEFSEVFGLGGPQGRPGYGGGMDFGVTREGAAPARTERMNFGPSAHMAGATAGAIGIDQMAPMRDYLQSQAPRQLPTMDVYGRRPMLANNPMQPTTAAPSAPLMGTFGAPSMAAPTMPAARGKKAEGKKAGGKGAPTPPKRPGDLGVEAPFDPNLNYLVTQALDQLLGGNEAEAGRGYQEYYATNPWPY